MWRSWRAECETPPDFGNSLTFPGRCTQFERWVVSPAAACVSQEVSCPQKGLSLSVAVLTADG